MDQTSPDMYKQAQELVEKNPVVFLEQQPLLFAKLSSKELHGLYLIAAEKDPTSTFRLVSNFAHQPFVVPVLLEAYRQFPSVEKTYPLERSLRGGLSTEDGDLSKAVPLPEYFKTLITKFRADVAKSYTGGNVGGALSFP